MTRLIGCAFLGLFAGLMGCVKNQSLSPPVENEYITVTVKVPPELKAEPLQVMYRSNICKQARYDSNGNRSDVDGYHGFDTSFQRKGETDLHEVELPRNGGGECRWNLSNVTFGVVHGTPSIYGPDVVAGGGGVIVVFDNNSNQQGGSGIAVKGDLLVRKEYYPWVRESFLSGYSKRVRLYAGRWLYFEYKAPLAKNVYFEPVFHSNLVTFSAGPKVKKKGNHSVFTYPDGRVVADGRSEPDLRILEAIRVKAESKK